MPNKKDPGYQVLTTAHTNIEETQPSDTAQEFLGAFGVSDGDLEQLTETLERDRTSTNMLSDSMMDLLKSFKSGKGSTPDQATQPAAVRSPPALHPIDHIENISAIQDEDERIGQMLLHKRNSIVYLVLDFMNFIEFGDETDSAITTTGNQKSVSTRRTKYFYGKSIFEEIKNIKKIKHAGTDREYATIVILQNFKEHKLARFRAAQIASMMLNYQGAFQSDAKD